MAKVILKAESISKQYRLGLVGTGTVKHDFNRFIARILGKEDPYLKVGAENDRSAKATENYVWALRDINFEVKEGEVLGIIGKNGAGKSTLLKILSRVTSPTTGVIKTKGRIASLLEVGTGFHPELTGRENIYLNGAILGMTKTEIQRKEEEIIDFSGCTMYIDTPVKRYSSGMRVRLAFAVAAHLEPDILVVDEVLAVGDAEFQKKAIGKMQDISKGEGRTVLFVSHDMTAIKSLCTRVVVLQNGKTFFEGETDEAIDKYLEKYKTSSGLINFKGGKNVFKLKFSRFEVLNKNKEISSSFQSGEKITFKTTIKVNHKIRNPIFSLRLSDSNNTSIICWRSNDFIEQPLPKGLEDDLIIYISTNKLFLLDTIYKVSISFLDGKELLDYKRDFISFEILPGKPNERFHPITKRKTYNSIVFAEAKWQVEQ
ncbi:ABC transporter ATP-binding protein [Marinirhabdus gelatinilytica]|uniref:Lipopolysaccharide transport system ATP-binding protein n=1 Tax=Marinirhabdus gelatinilytica TaxID=1703343 RepID=A0A370Q8X1_9FLAO|nr:ABC transporter ATP-binding protein [Marinirhabdus gelatinilytica]RDK84804.1 lipopolysaccharide transport system ATP-binding protein [Marinirhabdus gelatinilytica]